MRKRSVLLAAAAVILVGAVAVGSVFLGAFETSVVSRAVDNPLGAGEMKKLAERGAYVATAADCYACHTAKDGAPWAGGLPFETPFGTLYATNISPDKRFGIGNWTRAEFHRAVRDGVGKGARHLYPAMPYASYRGMSEADVDAVYAYLMTREPMPVENRRNELGFPFNIRQSLTFWNLANLPRNGLEADPKRSELWNRGRVVVDALAHCGECHTPRNLLQGMDSGAYLKGAVLEGVEAPDITKEGLTRMGFDPLTLAAFMKSGLSVQGSMTHQMFEVVHFSTQHMTEDDLRAMSAYLFDLDALPAASATPPAPKPVEVPAAIATAARKTYLDLCSGCHGAEGQGIPHVAVPLATNASLRLSSPRNFVRAVLHGIPAQRFPGLERMEAMPGFTELVDDKALADLTNWMRARWGGQQPNVTAEEVGKLR
ncbi:cytochrome c [Bosea sp. AS-1]|uniref:cytochrome c n=1 Tax=Bosea sp. AS-1 TaxID=2015316 RepID=UPI0020BE6C02|nr:cytochrome c [Bosea sp. AS-1]